MGATRTKLPMTDGNLRAAAVEATDWRDLLDALGREGEDSERERLRQAIGAGLLDDRFLPPAVPVSGNYAADHRTGQVVLDSVPSGSEITLNSNPPEPEPCPDVANTTIHGPHAWSVVSPGGEQGYTAHCPGWWPGSEHQPFLAPEYIPVDTSFEARQEWPEMHFTEDQLNGRELGQFIAGVVWGESCQGERRSWRIQIPTDKLAGVTAALVDRGFAVAKEWSHPNPHVVQLAVWSGL